MSAPLAWQGDGPPLTLPSLSLPHYSDQFDTSYSVASLTFIAAQLSTLLHTITVASSATASTPLNPHPTNLTSPAPYSPSSTLPPLSNSLTLCHSNLLTALSHVVSTSFHLLTLPAHLTAPLPSLPPVPISLSTPSSCPNSPPSTPSIAIPPRLTIRVVTDLEPVTPPTSRSHSPSPSKPSSAPHSTLTPSSSTAVQSDAPIAVQNDVVVKATLHLVSAAATSPASEAQPDAVNQEDDECSSPTPPPTTLPSATDSSIHPSTPTLTPAPSSPPTPSPTPTPTPTPAPSATSSHSVTTARGADSTVSADEIDVDAKATSHLLPAAATQSQVSPAPPVGSNRHSEHSDPVPTIATTATTIPTIPSTTTRRPATRSADTPIHPFFIDLTNRTGKAAKHFRRLYPATPTICECGSFPIFTDQRHSSAPTCTLPEPFQRLCLACLEELFRSCAELSVENHCNDVYNGVVAPHFWDDTWYRTFYTHYDKYYTPRQLAAIQETNSRPAAEVDYNRAFE